MPINLTGPAMEVARISSILKASKAKEQRVSLGKVIDAEVSERKQLEQAKTAAIAEQKKLEYKGQEYLDKFNKDLVSHVNIFNPQEWDIPWNDPEFKNKWRKGWDSFAAWKLNNNKTNWDQSKYTEPKVQQGLQTAAKAQEGKEASMNMRIAHKQNVYKGGKRL